jgi:SAM-dependent methyltransferase
MKKSDKEYFDKIRQYFLERGIKNNFDEKSFWGSKESQQKRFSALCKIADLNNSVILDYGCGKADLYQYLLDQNIVLKKYIGIDVVNEFVNVSKSRFNSQQFFCGDIEDHKFEGLDYIFASGVFCCFKLEEEMFEYSMEKIKYMFDLADKGVGVNFLSKRSTNTDLFSTYLDPIEVVNRIMREITPNVALIHNYLPNDFTVFIYKS